MIKILEITENTIEMIGRVASTCYNLEVKNKEKAKRLGLNYIRANHGRALEFAGVTFTVSGYSIRVCREIFRHIIGTSGLQESTRYVPYEQGFNFYTPNTIDKCGMLDEYNSFMKSCNTFYKRLIEAGVPQEDSANVLPLATNSVITMKFNVRSLQHLFEIRDCSRAYKEFRAFTSELRETLSKYNSEWRELLSMREMQVACIKNNRCTEKNPCKKKYKRHNIFVYGTLKKGEHNSKLLENAEFLCEDCIKGYKLYNTPYGFPTIVKSNNDELVYGEVYSVDMTDYKRVEALEGYNDNGTGLYTRDKVTTKSGIKAEVYVGNFDLKGCEQIKDTWTGINR